MNRLREARVYIGLSLKEAAGALFIHPTTLNAMEKGEVSVPDHLERAFSRLYQRPVGWLKGEPEEPLSVNAVLLDGKRRGVNIADLSDRDALEVARFAQWLLHRKEVPPC